MPDAAQHVDWLCQPVCRGNAQYGRCMGEEQEVNDLGGSSCMVKYEGKGRKMTGFQRHQKIAVLMDISKPSQTSMAK